MIIVMKNNAKQIHIESMIKKLQDKGLEVHPDIGSNQTILGIIGDTHKLDPRDFEVEEGVQEGVIETAVDAMQGQFNPAEVAM